MGITDVVRGDDHLSNTPKQLLVMRGARGRAAALRAPAAAARARRQEALQAPRRGQRAGAARGRLPARGGPQLPGAAGLGDRRRHHDHEHRGAGRALRRRATSGRASAIFDEQKLRWLNGRFMRELPLDEYTGGRREAPRPRARRGAAGRVRDRPGQGADAGRGVAADPLPVRGPRATTRRPEKVMMDGAKPAARGRACGAAGHRPLRARPDRGGAGADPGRARA